MTDGPFDVEIVGEYDGVDYEQAAADALDAVAIDTQNEWRDNMDDADYRNTGEAIRSITVESPGRFSRVVGSDKIQARIGEVGQPPGNRPPYGPISEWVNEQTGLPDRRDSAFHAAVQSVQDVIEERGLPAHRFGERAVEQSRDLREEITRRLDERLESGALD